MSINGIGMSDHSASWRKRRTQKSIPDTNFASHMANTKTAAITNRFSGISNGNGAIAEMASERDTYVSGTYGIRAAGLYTGKSISSAQDLVLPVETERYKIEDAVSPDGAAVYSITDKETGKSLCIGKDRVLPGNEANMLSDEQDASTHSEIIVKPDGSRVLVITLDIAGTQASISLQISEPTDMQNDIAKQKSDSGEPPVNASALTSDEISGSVSGGSSYAVNI